MIEKKSSQIIAIKTNGFENYLLTLPEESKENAKKKFASMATRFWFYIEAADGYRKKNERDKIMNFFQQFFEDSSLFPKDKYSIEDRKILLRDLIDLESLDISMNEIATYLKELPLSIKDAFFYDACLLVAIDKQIASKEVDFLDELAKELEIQPSYLQKIYQLFWIKQGQS